MFCNGVKTVIKSIKATIAKRTLEKAPAANTEYCLISLCLLRFCSSGSTKAPIMGPNKTIPVFLTLILWALATIPCANS